MAAAQLDFLGFVWKRIRRRSSLTDSELQIIGGYLTLESEPFSGRIQEAVTELA